MCARIPLAVLVLVAVAFPAAGQTAKQAPPPARAAADVNPHAAAVAEFQERLQKYIELRAQLAKKLKPLSPTANAAELAARQDSLAQALRTVRKDARPGDIVSAAVAAQIRTVVSDYFRRKDAATRRAVFEEVPDGFRPVINRTMPDNAALATMPPLLLTSLPRLPDNLQYRFVDRHIVLLDGDTRLIMDYILNVLPAH